MEKYGDYMKLFKDINDEDMVFANYSSGWDEITSNVHTWLAIEKEAETNPTLKDALDKCLVLYNLSKEHKNV